MNCFEKTNEAIGSMIAAAVEDWFLRQCKDTCAVMRAYYKPGEIACWIGEEPLNGSWVLASDVRISPAWTRERAKAFLWGSDGIFRRLPIFGA